MWYNLRKQIEEVAKYDYGTPESVKYMKKNTPGQSVKENDDDGEYDYEGEMAKNQLRTMIDAAQELHDSLEDNENMPEWVQGKITKATDYIDSVRDYMKSKSKDD
jgi:hypothetical protein